MLTAEYVSSEKAERSTADRVICFVCTGNTCRSPMAAALFNQMLQGSGYTAISRGLAACGEPISKNAALALEEYGVAPTVCNDYTAHISKMITENDISASQLVVGMTSRHAMNLIFSFPKYAEKITAFQNDIADPFGMPLDAYKRCLASIESELKLLAAEIGLLP